MNRFLRNKALRSLFSKEKPLNLTSNPIRNISQNSSKFPFSNRLSHLHAFYTGTGLLFSLFGVGYFYLNKNQGKCESLEQNSSKDDNQPKNPSGSRRLTREEAKKLIPQAQQLEELGQNEAALKLYRIIYIAYNRSGKGSRKRLTMLRQRIGILNALQGNYERALEWLTDSYETSLGLDDEQIKLDTYYDLCYLQYKLEDYSTANKMLTKILSVFEEINSEDYEILGLINQFLGFGYFRKGQTEKSEKYITKALKYMNLARDNKPFLYYVCNEFAEFYLDIGDLKKSLLFLEQAKILLERDSFFQKESIENAMKVHSCYTRKYIQDLRKEVQLTKITGVTEYVRAQLGDHQLRGDHLKKSSGPRKTKKNPDVHSLIDW